MMNRRRQSEASARTDDRRQREDDAGRLSDAVPSLKTLRLDFQEMREGGELSLAKHTRHVVVGRAPALFLVACGERDCDGTHDLTRQMLRELNALTTEFTGEIECHGVRNKSTCHHLLRYKAQASYSE